MKKMFIPVVRFARVFLGKQIRLSTATLNLAREGGRKRREPAIATENGFRFLLENGGRILLEKEGTKAFAPVPRNPPRMCLENGCHILMENGGNILLESTNQ